MRQDFTFLVPDHDLSVVTSAAIESGLSLADKEAISPGYSSEYCSEAKRFWLDDATAPTGPFHRPGRLVLAPLSWTGISFDDLEPLPSTDECYPMPVQGLRIYTVPLHVACAACVRILSAEIKSSEVRILVLSHLANLVAYNFFDMSKEHATDYSEDDTMTPEEVEDLKAAVSAVKSWAYPVQDQWIKDAIVGAMTGAISYNDIAAKETPRM